LDAICKAHIHYATYDSDQIEDLYRTVESGLKDNDCDGMRPFLGLFEALLKQTEANFAKKRDVFLQKFMELISHH
jgi:hypothetical protein